MGRVESRIKEDVLSYLDGLDATYRVKFGGGASHAKGTPDILVCHHGRFVALELKRPDEDFEEPSRVQRIRIKQIEDAEGRAAVVTSVKEVAAVLASVREEM